MISVTSRTLDEDVGRNGECMPLNSMDSGVPGVVSAEEPTIVAVGGLSPSVLILRILAKSDMSSAVRPFGSFMTL